MARKKNTEKEKQYEHLTYKKRLRLEVMLRQKIHKQEIANELGVQFMRKSPARAIPPGFRYSFPVSQSIDTPKTSANVISS